MSGRFGHTVAVMLSAGAFALLAGAWGRTAAAALVDRVDAPFEARSVETWESFPRAQVSGLRDVELPIFGGAATISGPNEYVYLYRPGLPLAYPETFGLGPFNAKTHEGEWGYGTSLNLGTSRITFAEPVLDFGGFWASSSDTRPIEFRFYDAAGAEVGRDEILYTRPNNDGTLQWQGWRFAVPVSRVQYTGEWVVQDSIRFGAVPEPAAASLVILPGVWALLGRRRR